jgi:hypothetical protein
MPRSLLRKHAHQGGNVACAGQLSRCGRIRGRRGRYALTLPEPPEGLLRGIVAPIRGGRAGRTGRIVGGRVGTNAPFPPLEDFGRIVSRLEGTGVGLLVVFTMTFEGCELWSEGQTGGGWE